MRRTTISVYLDTNTFIAAYEGTDALSDSLQVIFASVAEQEFKATTSELTLAELLPKPLILGQTNLADFYVDLLSGRGPIEVVPVTRAVLLESATLRGRHSTLKLADSIHLAIAVGKNCAAMLSNDRRFPSLLSMRLIRLGSRSLDEIRELGP